jgi:hypothetical protein
VTVTHEAANDGEPVAIAKPDVMIMMNRPVGV